MGTRLVEFYEEAGRLHGIGGRMRLAMMTRVSSPNAALVPDSPENIEKFEVALSVLRNEAGHAPAPKRQDVQRADIIAELSELHARVRSLQQTEDWLWAVLSSLHEAMVVTFERSGKSPFAWASRSFEDLGGQLDSSDFFGARYSDLVREAVARECKAELDSVFETGAPRRRDMAFAAASGTRWLSVSFSPVKLEEPAVVAFVQDVSAVHTASLALAQRETKLRRCNDTYVAWLRDKSLAQRPRAEIIARVAADAAAALDVARVSVWSFDEARSKLVCDVLSHFGELSAPGTVLEAKELPKYFAALDGERVISASDARRDPRTAEFSASYLAPLGINSMLDVPLWSAGKRVGVLCHEHIGAARAWSADEENFAWLAASFLQQWL